LLGAFLDDRLGAGIQGARKQDERADHNKTRLHTCCSPQPALLVQECQTAYFLLVVATALALISMMFLLMVRVNDPLVPRATMGVLNTLLYFPSGAVYPVNGFPDWMRVISKVDPFTYAVHAFKELLLKNAGFSAIAYDLSFLVIFAIIMMTLATLLFKRSL
jgi:ABC-type multidrug transport system permease subunit